MLQRREIIFDVGESLGGCKEGHLGPALAIGVADDFERGNRIAMGEFDVMFLAVAPDPQQQLAGQRIDDGDADAVQAAGNLVGVLVKFSAGVQLGHDDLGRRDAFALVNVDRNAAAVVAHRHRAVSIEDDFHGGGVTGERLVDGVVDDLIDHVVQAENLIGVAIYMPGRFRRIEPSAPGSIPRHIRPEWDAQYRQGSAGQVLSCEAFEGVPNQLRNMRR